MKLSEFKEKILKQFGENGWNRFTSTNRYDTYIAPEWSQLNDIKLVEDEIRFINNPTEEMQLEAVRKYGCIIKYIENPSEEVQLEAVKENGEAIKYINNPSEDLQLEAVKENGFNLLYINNPSEKVQLEAVKETAYAGQYLRNPTDTVIDCIIQSNNLDAVKYVLRHIENDLLEKTFTLSELRNMTLEELKELKERKIK